MPPHTMPVRLSILAAWRIISLTEIAAGAKTGPVTEQPPQASSDVVSDLLGASKNDPMGQHQGGKDGGEKDGEKKVKSQKERMDPEST